MKIQNGEESVRLLVVSDLHTVGVIFMKKEQDLFSDQRDGGFVEFSIQGDGAVFGDPSAGMFTKIIL